MPEDIIGYDASGKPIYANGGRTVSGYDATGAPIYEGEKPKRNWGSSEQLGNAWESAKTNLNPVTAVKGVLRLAKGAVDMAVPGIPTQDELNLTKMPGALKEHYGRYTSGEGIKDALYTDPFGVAMDATILAGPAGWGAKAAGMGRTANVIGKVGALADVPQQAVKLAARGTTKLGRAAIEKSISPPLSIIESMAESRRFTPKEMRRYLGDMSYDQNLPPTGNTVRTIWDKAKANVAEEGGMVQRGADAGRTVNMKDIAAKTTQGALSNVGEGHVIPKVRAYTRPNAAIAETKTKLAETFTQHPDLSVPFTEYREPILMYDDAMRVVDDATGEVSTVADKGITGGTGAPFKAIDTRIPSPAANPMVLRDVVQGANAKLRYNYGVNAPSDVEKVIDKGYSYHGSNALDDVAAGFEATPGRTRSVVDKETHDIVNLADAIVNRSYTSQQAPFKLWEMMGGLAGEPAVMAAGTLTRPPVMWRVGRNSRRTGEVLDKASGAIDPALVRAALLARLGQGQ